MGPRAVRLAFPLLLAAGALALGREDQDARILLEAGGSTFMWERGWAKLPEGMKLGNTHGCVIVDSQDRVYLNTDSAHAVVVFDAAGNYLRSFGAELAGGLHGMTLVEVDGEERLLLAHIGRHEVLACTLAGEILWTVGYPKESGIYASAEEYKPTSVVALPDGGFLVADGYGASWIHRYDAERKYVSSFGGPGTELGKLRVPHGLLLDTSGEEPVLLVADRENHRLQLFDVDGHAKGCVPAPAETPAAEPLLRRPCHMHPFPRSGRGSTLAVADLAGRVTLLDEELALVAHLGDNPDKSKRARNDVPPEQWKDGEFISPHCANWDSQGNLYVTDWLAAGRITKLARVK